jgi:ABC-type glycerol-3-phosphate transport system substrate-binding protein
MFSKKTIIISVVIFLILAGLFISGLMRGKKDTGYADFTFYGLENSDVFAPIIAKYKETHPNVTIKYKKFNDPTEYENLLVNEMAEGKGPDIFYVHNTWLPKHSKKITPLDSTVITPQNLTDTYVSVVANDFVQPDPASGVKKIYALPLYVDTLGLYYNKADFESKIPERGKPAMTWEGIKGDADKLRTEDSTTKALEHGEIALGRADNIRYAADILYNLFLQAGVDFYS